MEDLKKVIEQVIGKKDKEWEKPVYEIVKKIIDLPKGVDTTIANLIEYNPQKEMVDSLVQGKIANLVENVCNKMNIELVPTEDSLGGLAYYYHFKKIIIDSKGKKKETINEIIDDDFFTAEENTTISKVEYENLKMCEKDYFNFFGYSDFVLKIKRCSIIPIGNHIYDKNITVELAGDDNDRIDIEIYNEKEYSIFIKGKEYKLENKEVFNRIKTFVGSKIDTLTKWAINQNKENLEQNAVETGMVKHIKVKYGNLILNINGQVSDIGALCDEFIDNIIQIILMKI